jgi:hypothetical protein
MIERKTFQTDRNLQIAVTTERMADGTWGVVASVKQLSERSEKITDMPVPGQHFASQADAESYGRNLAEEWIEKNSPRVA